MSRRGGFSIESSPVPQEGNPDCRTGSPEEVGGPRLTSDSLTQESCIRKMSPQRMWLQFFKGTRGLGKTDFTLRAHTKSHTLWGPGQKQQFDRNLGQTYLLLLESLPGMQETSMAHAGDTDAGSRQAQGCLPPSGILVLTGAIVESSP